VKGWSVSNRTTHNFAKLSGMLACWHILTQGRLGRCRHPLFANQVIIALSLLQA
jgi:hypothetical protein